MGILWVSIMNIPLLGFFALIAVVTFEIQLVTDKRTKLVKQHVQPT